MTPNDTHDEIPSIVPERDELVQHRKQMRGTSQAARNAEAPGRTSGTVVFFLTLLFLGMCATGGGAWFFYQQGIETKAALQSATDRIKSLEATLNQMDESTKQSALSLRDQVGNNIKEVDKLWAARNALKTDQEKQGLALTAVQKLAAEHDTALNNHGNQLTQHNNQLNSAKTSIDQIAKSTAGLENLPQQFTTLTNEFKGIKTSQSSLDKRLRDVDQDIESINVFRQQTNQSLRDIKADVNTLQQKVGK